MLQKNYHMHSKYCLHAEGELSEYAAAALKNQLTEIGISDHIPLSENAKKVLLPYKWNSGSLRLRMDYSDFPVYLKEIENLKSEYKNQLNILAGFESEYNEFDSSFYKEMKAKVDYLNLGIHYVYKDGVFYDFMDRKVTETSAEENPDFKPAGHLIRSIQKKDVYFYMKNCVAALNSKIFNQLVHPDVFMRSFKSEDFDSELEEYSRAIIEAAVKNDVYLEINTSDIFRAKNEGRKVQYPSEEFWKIVSEYKNARILAGTDAHTPDRVADFQAEYVSAFIEKLNLKIQPGMEL